MLLGEVVGNLNVGLSALGAAVGIGLVGAKASEAVGRNPGAFNTVLIMALLAMALAEGLYFISAFVAK